MCALCFKQNDEHEDTPNYDEIPSVKTKLAELRRSIWSLRKNISILNHEIVSCADSTDDAIKKLQNFTGDIHATIKT